MTEKEFRKLRSLDLIQILLTQSSEETKLQEELDRQKEHLEGLRAHNEDLKTALNDKDAQIEDLKQGLNQSDAAIHDLREELKSLYTDKRINLENIGSLTEVAKRVNQIFEAAQREAEEYLAHPERVYAIQERERLECADPETDTQADPESMEAEAVIRNHESGLMNSADADDIKIEVAIKEPETVEEIPAVDPADHAADTESVSEADASVTDADGNADDANDADRPDGSVITESVMPVSADSDTLTEEAADSSEIFEAEVTDDSDTSTEEAAGSSDIPEAEVTDDSDTPTAEVADHSDDPSDTPVTEVTDKSDTPTAEVADHSDDSSDTPEAEATDDSDTPTAEVTDPSDDHSDTPVTEDTDKSDAPTAEATDPSDTPEAEVTTDPGASTAKTTAAAPGKTEPHQSKTVSKNPHERKSLFQKFVGSMKRGKGRR